MIVFWIVLSVIAGNIYVQAQQSTIIETRPSLPNHTIVTGYEGLQLSFQIQSGNYEACRWHYGDMLVANMFNQGFPCNNIDGSGYTLSCDLTNNLITSIWTILSFTSESVTIRVECRRSISQPEVLIASFYLNVTDCSTIAPLQVDSQSVTYDSSGNFSCTNNGSLYYSNETELTSTQTTCLASAEWSGQNGLGCWNGPSDVNIAGSLTVLEGHNINLTCNFTKGFPVMTNVSFNINNENIEVEEYNAILNRSDNKKPVYCQANNRFTEIVDGNSNDGRSPDYRFNVLYAPFQNTSNDCYLFSATDQDNMDCEVVFYSNPNATFVAVIDATSGYELNASKEIVIDGTFGKHTYNFTGFEITNVSSSTTYNLNVSIPQVPPFIHSIPFTVNIDIPTTTTVTMPKTVPGDGGGNLIINIVVPVLVVVVVIALIVLCILCWRRRQKRLSENNQDEHRVEPELIYEAALDPGNEDEEQAGPNAVEEAGPPRVPLNPNVVYSQVNKPRKVEREDEHRVEPELIYEAAIDPDVEQAGRNAVEEADEHRVEPELIGEAALDPDEEQAGPNAVEEAGPSRVPLNPNVVYSQVNKPRKVEREESPEKEVKDNEIYVPLEQAPVVREERMNNLYVPYDANAGNANAAYGKVNKAKKKPKVAPRAKASAAAAADQPGTSGQSTDAHGIADKTKKKPKPKPKAQNFDSGGASTSAGTADSGRELYGKVNLDKKKKKKVNPWN